LIHSEGLSIANNKQSLIFSKIDLQARHSKYNTRKAGTLISVNLNSFLLQGLRTEPRTADPLCCDIIINKCKNK